MAMIKRKEENVYARRCTRGTAGGLGAVGGPQSNQKFSDENLGVILCLRNNGFDRENALGQGRMGQAVHELMLVLIKEEFKYLIPTNPITP